MIEKNIQKRILAVYNNDGPGFRSEIIMKPSFLAIAEKIHTFIPQSSIIGMLFEHEEEYTVVESSQKGILQHDLFSWQVTRDDFVRLDDITNDSYTYGPPLPEGRAWAGCVIANGRLYVAGGSNATGTLSTSMISLELEPSTDPGTDPGTDPKPGANPCACCCKPRVSITVSNCTKPLARDLLAVLENYDLCEGACGEA